MITGLVVFRSEVLGARAVEFALVGVETFDVDQGDPHYAVVGGRAHLKAPAAVGRVEQLGEAGIADGGVGADRGRGGGTTGALARGDCELREAGGCQSLDLDTVDDSWTAPLPGLQKTHSIL